MQVIFESISGPGDSSKFWIHDGQKLRIGRTQDADVSFRLDGTMSRIHFQLECDGSFCTMTDLKSSNGTSRNGVRITKAVLRDGDEVIAGGTTFRVRVIDGSEVPDDDEAFADVTPEDEPTGKSPAEGLNQAMDVPAGEVTEVIRLAEPDREPLGGRWKFGSIPDNWVALEDIGLRKTLESEFPSNVIVAEEKLDEGQSLEQYIEKQRELLKVQLADQNVEFGEPKPAAINGAEKAIHIVIRFSTQAKDNVVQLQIYGQHEDSVGIITLTSVDTAIAADQTDFDTILGGIEFAAES